MKKPFLILLMCGGIAAVAQTKNQHPMIKEIHASDITGSSRAIIVDNVPLAHTSQLLPLNRKGEIVGDEDITKQTGQVFKNLNLALKEAGTNLDNAVKINVYISANNLLPQVQKQFSRQFRKKNKPAVSFVTGNLTHAQALIAMDAIATTARPANDKVKYLSSPALYKTVAAHVSILPAAGVTYVSGQADKGNLTEATRGTIGQLDGTLKFLGIKKEDVIQIKSFMQPMSDVSVVEREFAQFFEGKTVPPLVFVDWLSENPVIEIELIAASAVKNSKATEQLTYLTPPGMTASPIYSKVAQINHGKKIYLSSIFGDSASNSAQQTEQIYESMKKLLSDAGSDFSHLAKATYYVSDNKASSTLNEIRPKFYDAKRPPAASKAMIKGTGTEGCSINVDMIGVVKE